MRPCVRGKLVRAEIYVSARNNYFFASEASPARCGERSEHPRNASGASPSVLSERSELGAVGATSAASMVVLAGKNKIIIIKKIAA